MRQGLLEVKVTLVCGFAVINATSGSIMTVPTWKEMFYLSYSFVRIVDLTTLKTKCL